MTLETWAQILILLAVVGWMSTVTLVWSARHLDENSLTERAIAAVILSTTSSLFAILAGTVLAHVRLGGEATTSILIAIALLVNVPQVVWVLSLATGRFR